jgi:hypothetical protein
MPSSRPWFNSNSWRARTLTRGRMALALAVAVLADFLQIALLPLEWLFAQQIVDVIAMGLTMWLLGFHPLLLPTFVIEFIPVADMLPTWTGCVVAVIALRKRAAAAAIDVSAQVTPETSPSFRAPGPQAGPAVQPGDRAS